MKQVVLIFFFTTILLSSIEAQNPSYPYGLSFKSLFMDYQSQNGGTITDFGAYHHGFEIGLHKNINENINLVLPIKAGVVTSHDQRFENCFHKKVYGADIQGQYQFYKPDTKVIPYVMAGLGGVLEEEGDFNIQIPFGVGLNFKIKDNAYINWQSEYRYALADDRNNLHHGLGFVYLFGQPNAMEKTIEEEVEAMDSDGDGLADEIDLCPQMAGPVALKGCPDKDNDGIPDYRDDCPELAGIGIFKGCPDSDGDGISDSDDECPNKAGVKENNGCPPAAEAIDTDRDGDGVPDKMDSCPDLKGDGPNGCPKAIAVSDRDGDGVPDSSDKCPNSPGIASFGGCPDSDGDGIDDSRDRCPDTPGTVAANGCPEIARNDLSALEVAMRAVSFDTGKATLTSESYPVLNQIGQILNKYPNYNLVIEGHTDNVGSAINNQLLSERRAQACYQYLRDRVFISGDRMTHTGYGESRPVSSNDNIEGRRLNRRVVFNLVPR